MIRQLLAAAAIAGTAVCTAPFASADDTDYPDTPGRYATDVPGMNYDAHLADRAPTWSASRSGAAPVAKSCSAAGSRTSGRRSTPASGSRPTNCTACRRSVRPVLPQAAAQAPDGRPMLCLGARGWQPGFFTREGFFPR